MNSLVLSPCFSKLHPIPLLNPTINSQKSPFILLNYNNNFKCCSNNSRINNNNNNKILRTCKNCKTQYDPALNNPLACHFHPAHFGGETKRKFESVHTGGTMNTPNSGQVLEYWHCCGSEDAFDPGCTSSPHVSYDD